MAAPERPSFIAHWSEIEKPDDSHYDQDDELMSIGAPFVSARRKRRGGVRLCHRGRTRCLARRPSPSPRARRRGRLSRGHGHRPHLPQQQRRRGPPARGRREVKAREPHLLSTQSRAQTAAPRLVGGPPRARPGPARWDAGHGTRRQG